MIREIVAQLPYTRIVELTNLPIPLLLPSDSTLTDIDHLDNLMDYISGQRTWENLLTKDSLDEDPDRTILHAVKALEFGYSIDDQFKNLLHEVWNTKVQSIKSDISDHNYRLKKVNSNTPEAFTFAQELIEEIQSIDTSTEFPQNLESLEAFNQVQHEITKYVEDINYIESIAKDEEQINNETFYSVSFAAFSRLFDLYKEGSLSKDDHLLQLFKGLPDFILNKELEIVTQLADSSISLDNVSIARSSLSNVDKYKASRSRRRMARISKGKTKLSVQKVSHQRTAYSSSLFNSAVRIDSEINDNESLKRIRAQADNILNHNNRAKFWLGIAKSQPENQFKNLALGEGLLAAGIELIDKGQFLYARLTLRDAFVYLSLSLPLGMGSIEACAVALISSAIWPELSSQKKLNGSGILWINNPELLFELFRNREFLNYVAKIWINELDQDEIAEVFINIISGYFADDKVLLKECCSQLLSVQQIIKNSDKTIRRLWFILKDSNPPPSLYKLLHRVADEIPPESFVNLSIINGFNLDKLKSDITIEFEKLSKTNVAPVYEVNILLNDILSEIIKISSQTGKGISEPNLSLEQMVTKYYPEEKNNELELPIVLRNSNNAGIATDVSLRISCNNNDIDAEILNPELEFGDVQPGQAKEKLFFINLPEAIVRQQTEIRFQAEIRIGHRVHRRKKSEIKIDIRPSEQRTFKSSPYTPGSAVYGANFIGREREIAHIRSTLSGDSDQRVLLLYGIRRIGKTSILKNIQEDKEISLRYHTVFWDVEDFGEDTSTSSFVQLLIDKINDAIVSEAKKTISLSRADIKKDPIKQMEIFFKFFDDLHLKKRILLMIDEVDKLLHLSKKTELKRINESGYDPEIDFFPEVIAALRKCTIVNKNIYIIFSGLPDVVEQEYQSRLFGLADDIEVKEFSEADSLKIMNAGNSIMELNKFIQDRIINISGSQPYLLQVLCNKLFHRMKGSGRNMVADFDLIEVIEDIASKESIFTDYVSLMSDGWDVLYGLALAQKDSVRSAKYVSSQEIEESLARAGLEYNKEEIEDILQSYLIGSTNRPLVKRSPSHTTRYSMVVGLLADFLIRKVGMA
ncbi:ATP-binding protein [Thermodesulfobacteriota bacterium]